MVFGPDQKVRMMGGKITIDEAFRDYFDRIQVEHPGDFARQGVQQKITNVSFLRKDIVKKTVMRVVWLLHALNNGQIGPAAFSCHEMSTSPVAQSMGGTAC